MIYYITRYNSWAKIKRTLQKRYGEMAAGSDRKEGREKKGGGNRKRSEINQRDDPAYIYRRSCATHTADKTEKDLLLLLVIWTNTGWKGHRQYVAILIDVGSSKSFGCIRSYISGCMGMMMGECARLSLSLMYYPDIVVKTSPLSPYTHTHTILYRATFRLESI